MTLKLEDSKPKGHTYLQWLVAILANTSIVSYGLEAGWVSPVTKILQSPDSPTGEPLSDIELSWVASIICLVGGLAVPVYVYIADSYGRKTGIIVIAVTQGLSWIIKLSSANTATIIASRVFGGLAAGGCFNVIPMYVKEISEDSIRGLTGSLLAVSQYIGVLGIYALGAYLDYFTLLWVVVWLPMVTAAMFVKAPESPAYLVKIGKIDEATEVIAYLRGLAPYDKSVQNEIDCMRDQDEYFKSLPDVSFRSIFSDKAWRRGFIGIMLIMSVHACNGSFSITNFAASILTTSGVTVSPELQSLSFPAVMILASFFAMGCVEKIGRKPLLISMLALITLSMVSIATIVLLQRHGGVVPGWLSVLSIVGALFGYAGALLPVPYIMMAEMFNFQVRAKLMGLIVFFTWLLTFCQLFAFAPISNTFGLHTMFYCFAAINFLGIFVTLVLLPETRGKSVEQIEAELRGK